jgi:L-lactate dehydrogenase complex protein LldG
VSAAREEILKRVRRSLADVPESERPEDVLIPRGYLENEPEATFVRFVERVRDYKSLVQTVAGDDVASGVRAAMRDLSVSTLVVPHDLPTEWIPPNAEVIVDDGISPRELDRIGAALTGCSLGIAETGTVVLDAGAAQGRRLLTLVPDVHICVIREEQVVDGVPAAMRRLGAELRASHRPLTFVSGPSATSDIELTRVEGVHGPRRFALVIAR